MPSEDAKPVNLEREVKEEDDEEVLGSMVKKKHTKSNSHANGTAKTVAREAKVKKEKQLDQDSDKAVKANPKQEPSGVQKVEKELKKKQVKKMEEEGKKKKGSEAKTGPKKKEKKIYELPGQKRDPPEERDPLRIFYETLYEQNPNSEMAEYWLMECGLLSKEEAKRVFEKKQKRSQQQKLGSPMKAVASVKKTTQSVTVKKKAPSTPAPSNTKKSTVSKDASNQSKKRKKEDESSESGSDDDFVIPQSKKRKQST